MTQSEDPLFEQVLYFLKARREAFGLLVSPPKDPRRTKRKTTKSRWHHNNELLELITIHNQLAPQFLREESDIEYAGERFHELSLLALKNGDNEFWQAVSDITKQVNVALKIRPSDYPIAVHAIHGKVSIHHLTGSLPTKDQVKKWVVEKCRMEGSKCYGIEDSSRWTEVFRAAGLSHLPSRKPKRGLNKHGNK